MSQTKQMQKAKLYRVLKIVFYTLGLPLFFFAVICTAIKFIGEDPFVGMASSSLSSGMFEGYERFINSPALYGIWCALAVWAFIAICHGVLSKLVKNFRVKLFSMLAIILVVMLGTMGIMDAAYEAQIDKLIAEAPAGVTVQDYKSQLSYYDYVSYNRRDKSLINQLMKNVDKYKDVYNIKYQGINKSGDAGNIANKPVDYYYIIDDNGNRGADYDGDSQVTLDVEGKHLVEVAPNKDGKLVLNGNTYSNYFYITRGAADGTKCTVWYSLDLVPVGYKWNAKKGKMEYNTTEGVYGEGLYNASGLLSDGWIFSLENVLEILEDLYAGQEYLATADQSYVQELQTRALELRDKYYKGEEKLPSTDEEVSARIKELYSQEVVFDNNYAMPRERLELIVSYLGQMLGNNNLFDWLFSSQGSSIIGMVGGMLPIDLGALINNGYKGISLTTFLTAHAEDKKPLISSEVMAMILNAMQTAFEQPDLKDVYLVLSYKTVGKADAVVQKDNLYLGLYKDNGSGAIDKSAALFELDFTDEVLNAENGEYAFDLDSLSELLNNVLNTVLQSDGISGLFDTLKGLVLQDMEFKGTTYQGLSLGGINIPLIVKDTGEVDIDLVEVLTDVVKGWYSYQSPVIKPVWEFYEEVALKDLKDLEDPSKDEDHLLETARMLAAYERAYYEATVYGSMIGSTLYGDTLGAGNYPAALGLTDLASVRQLKSDLSYQPKNFPLYSFRDMLLTSSGVVMLFYLLYMIAAKKEKEYALGVCCKGNGKGGDDKDPEGGSEPEETPEEEENGKLEQSVLKVVDNVKARTNWDDKKTSLASKILSISLYVIAFLPLLIISLVYAAKSSSVLPAYGGWHFIGFIVMLVFALIFAAVVVFLNIKVGKKDKRNLGTRKSRGLKIIITYVCLTTVFGLILTYVLPDPIAKATSSTLYTEDMYYNHDAQVEENAALERQFIMYNLLNGNLNHYDSTGEVATDGDFSYETLKKYTDGYFNNGFKTRKFLNPEIEAVAAEYRDRFGALAKELANGASLDMAKLNEINALFDEITSQYDEHKAELYNFVYQYKVLNDVDFGFAFTDSGVSRRLLAIAITEYLYKYADYEQLLKDGFGNPRLKQLFDNNYDSFNQDGYKTFDDSLLLYAQLDGRMTMPVIIRLILNNGWTYSQADVKEGEVVYSDNSFLYETYDVATRDAYAAANSGKTPEELYPYEGTITNSNGKTITVNYGLNEDGWQIYSNGVVKRPLNWLVLDMLGTPMDLASIDLSAVNVMEKNLGALLSMVGTEVINALDGTLNEDVYSLVTRLTDGAGLRIGVYIDDNASLQLQLMPMNVEYGMLGYMQATWVQSNNLLMAVINLSALRNMLYIFGGIGLVLILLATYIAELGDKANKRLADATTGEALPEGGAEPEAAPEETPAEETPEETPAEETATDAE